MFKKILLAVILFIATSVANAAVYISDMDPIYGGYRLVFTNTDPYYHACSASTNVGGYANFTIAPYSSFYVDFAGPSIYFYVCD